MILYKKFSLSNLEVKLVVKIRMLAFVCFNLVLSSWEFFKVVLFDESLTYLGKLQNLTSFETKSLWNTKYFETMLPLITRFIDKIFALQIIK